MLQSRSMLLIHASICFLSDFAMYGVWRIGIYMCLFWGFSSLEKARYSAEGLAGGLKHCQAAVDVPCMEVVLTRSTVVVRRS